MRIPEVEDIVNAFERIKTLVHYTPVMTCEAINKMTGAELFFKCENFQKVGAFKYRGATNAVLQLNSDQKARGVTTHSSGNHAAALALAAAKNGVKAHIVMPDNAPEIKKKAVAAYGGEITFCEGTLKAREEMVAVVQKKTGATLIHPYNQFDVICGQGTASLELLQQIPDLNIIMAPVGGGGLLSGTATYVKGSHPHIEVIAGEPEMANDAFQSFKQGQLIPVENPQTVADGLRTSLGHITFEIISKKVDDIYTVSEESIVKAMRLVWERMKIIIEPSSAVPLAVVLENELKFKDKKIGIIFTGGNVDLENLPF